MRGRKVDSLELFLRPPRRPRLSQFTDHSLAINLLPIVPPPFILEMLGVLI